MDVDGHRALFCEVCDIYPVLNNLRDWMERCLSFDRYGMFHPEIVTLNLADSVYSIVLIHVGWEDSERGAQPVSAFIVVREDQRHPLLCEFCYPVDTLFNLYDAIQSCLKDYRSLFDNPECWYDIKRFDRIDRRSTTDRLLRMIKSSMFELKSELFSK